MVSQDPYLYEVFKHTPLTAFRRQRNIRDNLIREKVPKDPKLHPVKKQQGMKKCGNNCTTFPHIREVKSI